MADKQPASERFSHDALLAEYEFIREGMRQDQRERLVVLGFVLAASSAILGLLVRGAKQLPTSNQAFVLITVALAIAIVGEVLTIRATIGVASAGHYVREFIESRAPELAFQTRNRKFYDQLQQGSSGPWRLLLRPSVSGSAGLALAYGILSAGLLGAWFVVDLSSTRGLLRSAAICVVASVSGGLTWQLWWTAKSGAKHVGDAWAAVRNSEKPAAGDRPEE